MADFIESYKSEYEQIIEECKKSTEEIKESRVKLENLKQNYFMASLRAEKAAQMAGIEDVEDRVLLANKNFEVMKTQMIKASGEYLEAMATEKQLWGEYEINRKQGSDYLKKLENSRFQFLRRCIKEYSLIEKKELLLLNDFVESISNNLNNFGTECNLENYKDILLCENVEKEDWISYEQWKNLMKNEGKNVLKMEENYICIETGYKPMDSSVALIKTLVYSLIPSKAKDCSDSFSSGKGSAEDSTCDSIESELFYEFSVKIMDPDHWDTFMYVLESRSYIGYIEPANMNNLASLLATITSIMMDEKMFNIEIFYKIVNFSHCFHTIDCKRVYLSKFLATQPIFKVGKYWVSIVNFAVLRKLATEKALFKRTQERLKKMGKPPQKSNKNSAASVTCSMLSHFIFYMVNLGIPTPVADSVIRECAKKHKLTNDSQSGLIIELYSIQTVPPSILTSNKSLRHNAKNRFKWGINLYLGLSFDYLQIKEIPELLLVCKHWNTILSPQYYKTCLLTYNNTQFRRLAWRSILYKPSRVPYKDLKSQLESNPKSIKDFADVIKMDIFRSFNNNTNVNSAFLEEILKVYAYYKPKVGYCQGMHYLASTLAEVLGDSEEVFWAMDELIRYHQMQQLYGQDMNQLKIFFYILDRLITLHVPEVRQVLNAENIVSNNYCVTWFITLFASQLSAKPRLLMRIWDYFVFVTFM